MPENELLVHLTSDNSIEKILDSTCNTIEAIARKKGGEYDNLTAAIIEMGQNSSIQPKMTKTAKIIIAILAALLLISIIINILVFKTSMLSDYTNNIDNTEQLCVGEIDSISFSGGKTSIILNGKDSAALKKATKLYINKNHE